MNATRWLLQHRQPLIRFVGKRTPPAMIDHTPAPHPASPTNSLPPSFQTHKPNTFASYRAKAQQHGPLNSIGNRSGHELGPVEADKGEYFDRSLLPRRFARIPWTLAEIEAIESGGASLHN